MAAVSWATGWMVGLWLCMVLAAVAQLEQSQFAALLAFRGSILDDPQDVLENWSIDKDPCDWRTGELEEEFGNKLTPNDIHSGVTCDADGRRIIAISLRNDGLRGRIPREIAFLDHLRYLDLDSNRFEGTIPPEMRELKKLRVLDLGRNGGLTGSIPAELGHLISLEAMDLAGNQLTGPVPNSFQQLQNLTYLRLGRNQLTGPVPAFFAKLVNLEYLLLHDNVFGGVIPASLGLLSKLKQLALSNNELTGIVPPTIARNLRNLELLTVYNNTGLCGQDYHYDTLPFSDGGTGAGRLSGTDIGNACPSDLPCSPQADVDSNCGFLSEYDTSLCSNELLSSLCSTTCQLCQ
eukprot:scaffold85_cov358-Pavlova_lutheri.AAC.14